jgi:hypothetical protein
LLVQHSIDKRGTRHDSSNPLKSPAAVLQTIRPQIRVFGARAKQMRSAILRLRRLIPLERWAEFQQIPLDQAHFCVNITKYSLGKYMTPKDFYQVIVSNTDIDRIY